MATAQFVDISVFQGTVDFRAYCTWAKQWDGLARIAIKATEGVGFTDPTFAAHRAGALAAGIEGILYYHFARPDLGNTPASEADYAFSVIGSVRGSDIVMLDYEVASPLATAEWAYQWLARQEQNYRGKLPGLYANTSYIEERLQDSRLARYALWLADWHFSPDVRPSCPPPWKRYTWLQYTDRATAIPGISGVVDGNIFVGGHAPVTKVTGIPAGWSDDGTTLVAPNNYTVVKGMRDYITKHHWDASNWPVEEEQHNLSPLEMSNPSLGPGNRQRFRMGTLEYTTTRGVFPAYTGPEMLAMERRIHELNAQVAALQAQLAAGKKP